MYYLMYVLYLVILIIALKIIIKHIAQIYLVMFSITVILCYYWNFQFKFKRIIAFK